MASALMPRAIRSAGRGRQVLVHGHRVETLELFGVVEILLSGTWAPGQDFLLSMRQRHETMHARPRMRVRLMNNIESIH